MQNYQRAETNINAAFDNTKIGGNAYETVIQQLEYGTAKGMFTTGREHR